MANKVTAHNSIANVRNELTDETKVLKKVFQDLFAAMRCDLMKAAYITSTIDTIKKQLKNIDSQLCNAQQAATALAGVNRKVTAKSVSFNVSSSKGSHTIDINVPGSRQALEAMMNSRNSFASKTDTLKRCKNEIASLAVSDQILSSISIMEIFFPALALGKVSKAVVVSKVKQTCVDSISSAIKSINTLSSTIVEFAGPEKVISKLINEFDSCETNVFNKYGQAFAKKYTDKTSAYDEGHVPDEAELKGRLDELESARNELISITGQSCKDLDEEVARLKKLYDSIYGTVTLTPNMEGHSMKQTDYALPYKGNNWGCCATAYAIGMSIVNGKYYNPENTFTDQCTWAWGGVDQYQSGINFQQVYDKLKQGKPVLFHYGYGQLDKDGNRPQHWVLINGINTGANYDNLDYKDFKILDPGAGDTEKNLGELVSNTNGFIKYGYKCFS